MYIKTPWTEIDDVFYEARGASWALIHFLKAAEVDFADVLRTLARDLGKAAVPIRDEGGQFYSEGSDWVLLSSNRAFLDHPAIDSRVRNGWSRPVAEGVRWTDDYSNLLEALR